jgi:hypothetical protein
MMDWNLLTFRDRFARNKVGICKILKVTPG